MIALCSANAMTIAMEYESMDAEASAALAAQKAFGGAVRVRTLWEVDPVRRILELEHPAAGPPAPEVTGEAGRVARAVIAFVAELGFDQIPPPFVGAVGAGGVSLEWNVGPRELSFFVYNDGSIEYLKAGEGEPFEEGPFSLWRTGQLRELVNWVVGPRPAINAAA
jgi:hypothetical protein